MLICHVIAYHNSILVMPGEVPQGDVKVASFNLLLALCMCTCIDATKTYVPMYTDMARRLITCVSFIICYAHIFLAIKIKI